MSLFNCNILGVGTWGSGFTNIDEFYDLVKNPSDTEELTVSNPKPAVIPPNERRRAPLPVRLAVETSAQACEAASIDPKDLTCIFASGLGDTQLTDYMCKTLAGEQKALSPTKFHNSVHNAAAGYWTISTGCMKPASTLAGLNGSTPMALLEALSQCDIEARPVLLTIYDSPSSQILSKIFPCKHSFSVSFVIAPTSDKSIAPELTMEIKNSPSPWPKLPFTGVLLNMYENNPAARALAILYTYYLTTKSKQPENLIMPISADRSINLRMG